MTPQTLGVFIKFGIPIPGIAYPVNPKRNMTIVIDDTPAPANVKANVQFAVPKALPKTKYGQASSRAIVIPDEVFIKLISN